MANETAASASGKTGNSATGKGQRGKRKSREEQGLPPLSREQSAMRSLVQQAQNACSYLKKDIDSGKCPTKEVLRACGVLGAALGASLGSE